MHEYFHWIDVHYALIDIEILKNKIKFIFVRENVWFSFVSIKVGYFI